MGGLSFVGGILSKPGRVVRGLFGGTPREALNVIPFSDTLGITDPSQEVTGQHLLGSHDAPLLSPEGAAGFGVDVLTDPLTYLSFGGSALTKLGLAAKKAGTLPANLAERAAQGLGGHIGVGLPGMGTQRAFDLSPIARGVGAAADTVAGAIPGGAKALEGLKAFGGAASDFYHATIPPLFQGSVMGRKTAAGQEVARAITAGTPEAQAAARLEAMPLAQRAFETGLAGPEGSAAIRRRLETGLGLHPMAPGWTPAAEQAVEDISSRMAEGYKASIARKVEQGLPSPILSQQEIRQGIGEGQNLGYTHRQATPVEPKTIGEFFKPKNIKPLDEHARADWTTGLTTENLNRLATEPIENFGIRGTTLNPEQQVQKTVMDRFLGGQRSEAEVQGLRDAVKADQLAHQGVTTDLEQAGRLKDAEASHAALQSQAAEIARMKVNGSLPQFANHAIADYARYIAKDFQNELKATEIYKGLAGAAQAEGAGTVPVMDALKRMWRPSETAGESLVDKTGRLVDHTVPQGAQVAMADALGIDVEHLKNIHVDARVANDLAGFSKMNTISGMEQFAKLWDSVTNLTKAGQTMFPSTVVRNGFQDMFNKMVYGAHDPSFAAINPQRYIQPMLDWHRVANGGTVEGLAAKLQSNAAFKGLDDAAAAAKMRELYTAWDVGHDAGKRASIAMREIPEVGAATAEKSLESLRPVNSQKNPLAAYVGGLKEGSYSPKNLANVAGVLGKTEDVFAPVKAMRAANNALDNSMRGSSFLAFLEQGYEPAEALKQVVKAHYDFSNMSQFERGTVRRVVPFYNWARQNVPAVIKEIAENPGGKLATSLKATVAAKGEHPGFVPAYLGEGVAAPIGEEQNGQQRFLSRLGLGFEDLGQLAGPGGPLGMLNPLIKAPIEAATGKQLFTGRDLRDLHSRLGDLTGAPLPVAENLVMNSPAGRILSTAGTLADPRKSIADKAVNLLTGARLTDVNIEQARQSAVRDYLQQNLHGPGVRHFDELSVRPDNLALLSPEQQRLYQLYRSMQGGRPLPAP